MLIVDEEAQVRFDDRIADAKPLAITRTDFQALVSDFNPSLTMVFMHAFALANLSANIHSFNPFIDEQSPFVWQTLEDLMADACQTAGNCDGL
jgi:hypothetical protein